MSGKTDYTIVLSAHYDSSWNWNLAKKNPKTFIPKIVYGVVGLLSILVFGFVLQFAAGGAYAHPLWTNAATITAWKWYAYVGYILPIVCIPGLYFITQFLSHDKTIASPGCMDNLTGIGLNQEIAKHFSAHPEDLPENCRLICAAMACEESGLRGSRAFVKHHKDDGMLKLLSDQRRQHLRRRLLRGHSGRRRANVQIRYGTGRYALRILAGTRSCQKDGQNLESRRRLRQHPVLPCRRENHHLRRAKPHRHQLLPHFQR
ncbi:MAG: M28 family peptidase [Clostridium sp.]|nr:MAG: M28 family peptidase [Clostridium sp.]